MQFYVSSGTAASLNVGALVVPVFADGTLGGATETVDRELGGAIAELLASGEITGKAGEHGLIRSTTLKTSRVLVVGLGDRARFEVASLARYAGTALRYLGKRKVTSIAFALPAEALSVARDAATMVVEGALMGSIDATTYRTEPEKPIEVATVHVLDAAGAQSFDRAALTTGVERGRVIGEAVNAARIMALTPANDMTPTHMAARATELGKQFGLEVDVLDEARMLAKGMGSLLGVSRGSDEPATLSVMTYTGDPASTEKLALVGKGLTFDSGGISIKPADNMHEMKYDMSGGAAVIAAMSAIAQLKPKINVIGIVPSSENLPGPRAMKPGDVLRAMNGKTIEVINTDAEGRLILADALCYARELGATRIIDAATLTGAMVVALGHEATGTIGNDDAFAQQFIKVANESGERYWQLPLYDEYTTTVKSEIADLRNSTGRPAGGLTAAAFLKAFVADLPWIHLDVAGTAYTDRETPYLAKGPTGAPVRGFVAFAEALASSQGNRSNGNGATVAHAATAPV